MKDREFKDKYGYDEVASSVLLSMELQGDGHIRIKLKPILKLIQVDTNKEKPYLV